MAIGLTVIKPFAKKCRLLCTPFGKSMDVKVMAFFFQTQKSTWCTHSICIIFSGCIKYMKVVNSCKLYGNETNGFYAANASTDINAKLKLKFTLTWCPCIIHCILDKTKNKQKPRKINYKLKFCQKAVLSLNGIHLSIPSTECWTLLPLWSSNTTWVGTAYARSFSPSSPWASLSISGNDDPTSPHITFQGMTFDCSTQSSLKFLNFFTIPSFVCLKYTCIEVLITSQWPTQNGIMQKVNIFCTGNDHLHAFYAPT